MATTEIFTVSGRTDGFCSTIYWQIVCPRRWVGLRFLGKCLELCRVVRAGTLLQGAAESLRKRSLFALSVDFSSLCICCLSSALNTCFARPLSTYARPPRRKPTTFAVVTSVLSSGSCWDDLSLGSFEWNAWSRVGRWLDPSVDWIGSGFSGNFMDWMELDGMTVTPFQLLPCAAQLMLFLSNYDLWTLNCTRFTTILKTSIRIVSGI